MTPIFYKNSSGTATCLERGGIQPQYCNSSSVCFSAASVHPLKNRNTRREKYANIHRSATTLKAQVTGELININHLVVQCSPVKPWVLTFILMSLDAHHQSKYRCRKCKQPPGNSNGSTPQSRSMCPATL